MLAVLKFTFTTDYWAQDASLQSPFSVSALEASSVWIIKYDWITLHKIKQYVSNMPVRVKWATLEEERERKRYGTHIKQVYLCCDSHLCLLQFTRISPPRSHFSSCWLTVCGRLKSQGCWQRAGTAARLSSQGQKWFSKHVLFNVLEEISQGGEQWPKQRLKESGTEGLNCRYLPPSSGLKTRIACARTQTFIC